MSRKDLSRTVIEGGRYYRNSFFRRASHGDERATTREWLDLVINDLDEADASAPPARRRIGKMFHDKLAPAMRWLRSQVGRPWTHVYSELCSKFDSRTVAGRHVVQDHMLRWVVRHDAVDRFRYPRSFELMIDRHGVLREPTCLGRSYSALTRDVLGWANGRVCALTFRGWWWFRREGIGEPCPTPWKCGQRHHELVTGDRRGGRYHGFRLLSEGAMSRGQARYLERLPPELRDRLVIASPWRSR